MTAALAQEVERAAGPSRELDAKIDAATHGRTIASIEGAGTHRLFNVEGRYWYDGARFADPPRYTSSIDSALTLLPEGMLARTSTWGEAEIISSDQRGKPSWERWTDGAAMSGPDGTSKAARALVAAILRARAAQTEGE